MSMSRIKSVLALAFALGGGLSASGCSEYKYYDISVKFDNTFNTLSLSQITFCKVTVSGADSGDFRISNCPPPSTSATPKDSGVFTYSSFADSGVMNFKLETFTSVSEKPNCISGGGTVAIPVAGATTLKGDLIVTKTAEGCTSVTPPTDGG